MYMDIILPLLELGAGTFELNHNEPTNQDCPVNTVAECGCIHNNVAGYACPKK